MKYLVICAHTGREEIREIKDLGESPSQELCPICNGANPRSASGNNSGTPHHCNFTIVKNDQMISGALAGHSP